MYIRFSPVQVPDDPQPTRLLEVPSTTIGNNQDVTTVWRLPGCIILTKCFQMKFGTQNEIQCTNIIWHKKWMSVSNPTGCLYRGFDNAKIILTFLSTYYRLVFRKFLSPEPWSITLQHCFIRVLTIRFSALWFYRLSHFDNFWINSQGNEFSTSQVYGPTLRCIFQLLIYHHIHSVFIRIHKRYVRDTASIVNGSMERLTQLDRLDGILNGLWSNILYH